MTIFKRLVISYLIIIILILFLGAYITFRLNRLNRLIDYIVSVDSVTVKLIDELTSARLTQSGFEEKYLISKDRDFYQRFCEIGEYFMKNINKLEDMSDTSEKKRLIAGVKKVYNEYFFLIKNKSLSITEYPNEAAYQSYQAKKKELIHLVDKGLKEISQAATLDREQKMQTISAINLQLMRVIVIIAAIATIIGVSISLLNASYIYRPVLLLQEKTREVAKGNFGQPLNIFSPPEIKELACAINTMCESLEELDKMKIDFISHVSHQLRTPLTAIREASCLLLEGIFADAPEKEYELFSIVQEECERLITAVNRILDLSSMEARMLYYNFNQSDIISILKKGVLKLAPLAQRKKITIDTNIPDNLPNVRIDEERIAQVVEDLLGNALKFTSDGGRITIAASEDIEKRMMRVSISDTGCSIPKEELEEIFVKFKRIESGLAAERGTGLGLSIAKHIIIAHGGHIWAESEPGKGSTFYFTLCVS